MLCLILLAGLAQISDLQRAYDELRVHHYDLAVAAFRDAVQRAPQRPDIRKDLAYTLLKIGETEAARDQFEAAVRLDPADDHVALEYAFLCFETKKQREARRIFDRVRRKGNSTAEQAFQNVDKPLAEGIERWSHAVELSPGNFSAHHELAQLAEQRDQLSLAAEQYAAAWKLKPELRSLLLDLGRVWREQGETARANTALLAASRGAEPRVAEAAREILPHRYPYLYEFEQALALDDKNVPLRREYAYLLLQMGRKPEAEEQFRILAQLAPDDLLSAAQLGFLRLGRRDLAGAQPLLERVLQHDDGELADRVREALNLPKALHKRPETSRVAVSGQAKMLAERSLQAGYLKDALKYLRIAHENDPVDFNVMLKLGWAYNILHDDAQALQWFKLARRSPDPDLAREAEKAFHNLAPAFARFRTTVWMFPFYSSRWHDAFSYGQIKTEFRLGSLPIRPYVSTRFIGDLRQTTRPALSGAQPQYLSESSFIFGVGLATANWKGAMGWFEAGEAVKYLGSRKDVGAMVPDYRGGVSFAKGWGRLLGAKHGAFAETNEDGVFVSRFQNDLLFYTQNRTGYTFPKSEVAGVQAQVYWNYNATLDSSRQYWASFVETGPGLRFRTDALPKSMLLFVNVLRGAYTVNKDNPRRPNFFDVRAGVWYAFTH